MMIVKEIIQKSNAILHSDGLKIYDALIELVNKDKVVEISFEGIAHCTTAFLNASVGKAWMNNPDFSNSFRFSNVSSVLQTKIDLVKENALDREKRENRDQILRSHLEEA